MLAKEKRDGTFSPDPNAPPMTLLRPTLALSLLAVATAGAVDFQKDIQPILEKNCYECHSEKANKRKGGFVFDDLKTFKLDIADNDVAQIRPGKPGESHFLEVIVNEGHERHMPPKGQLSRTEINKITDWIKEGATFDGTVSTVAATPTKKALPPIMSWTNLEGKTIKAGFVRLEGENVVLRMPANAAEVAYPLAKLSEASQKLARDCAEP
jgi:mono/diheme cytochrome c family protein